MNRVASYYNSNPLKEWDRLKSSAYHSIESEITKKFILKYIKANSNVADVGCGPGHYSTWLLESGHNVLMTDLSNELLELAKLKMKELPVKGRLLGIQHLSATNLEGLDSNKFDMCLLMGPLYHLLEIEQRKKAISEAARITKPGGYIFSAIINRLCPFRDMMFGSTEKLIHELLYDFEEMNEILTNGKYENLENAENVFTDAYFSELDEVPKIYSEQGIELIETFSCEGIAAFLDERAEILKQVPKAWEKFIEIVYKTSTNPGLFAGGEHTVFIGQVQ